MTVHRKIELASPPLLGGSQYDPTPIPAMSPQIGNTRHAMGGTRKHNSNIHLPYNQALQEEYAGYESVWRARSSAGSEISVGICAPLEAVLLHGDSNALPGTLPPSSAAAQSWGGSTRASTPSRDEDETHIHEVLVCSSPGADSVDFSRIVSGANSPIHVYQDWRSIPEELTVNCTGQTSPQFRGGGHHAANVSDYVWAGEDSSDCVPFTPEAGVIESEELLRSRP